MLKKICVALMLIMPLSMFAQDLKFGHLNRQTLIEEMPKAQAAMKTLEDKVAKYKTEGGKMQDDLKKKYDEYIKKAEGMSDVDRSNAEMELKQLQERIQNYGATAEKDLEKTQVDLMAPIEKEINEALSAVGSELGLMYIFDAQMPLYVSDKSIDVLPYIKKKLNIDSTKPKAAAPVKR